MDLVRQFQLQVVALFVLLFCPIPAIGNIWIYITMCSGIAFLILLVHCGAYLEKINGTVNCAVNVSPCSE